MKLCYSQRRSITLGVDGTDLILLRRRHPLVSKYLVALSPAGFSEAFKIFQLLFYLSVAHKDQTETSGSLIVVVFPAKANLLALAIFKQRIPLPVGSIIQWLKKRFATRE